MKRGEEQEDRRKMQVVGSQHTQNTAYTYIATNGR